jgi:hypothetical protein
MPRLTIEDLSPNASAVDPTVEIRASVPVKQGVEIVTSASMTLSVGGEILGYAARVTVPGYQDYTGRSHLLGSHSTPIYGQVTLSKRALARVEAYREAGPSGDVDFVVDVTTQLADVGIDDAEDVGVFLQRGSKPSDHAFAPSVRERDPARPAPLLIRASHNPLLRIRLQSESERYRVSSSDWVQRFRPAFGMGRYVLLEYPEPESLRGGEPLGERLADAIEQLQVMSSKLAQGDWTGVMVSSRGVSELIRAESSAVRDLLVESGLPGEAASDLLQGVRALFGYASKYVHRLDRKGERTIASLDASKEDALMAYALSASLLNAFASKRERLRSDF